MALPLPNSLEAVCPIRGLSFSSLGPHPLFLMRQKERIKEPPSHQVVRRQTWRTPEARLSDTS